jgi:hypothetical protein
MVGQHSPEYGPQLGIEDIRWSIRKGSVKFHAAALFGGWGG